ncbi:MAG: Hsp20/alpha crystallin family protein [Chloroflexota bacterium]
MLQRRYSRPNHFVSPWQEMARFHRLMNRRFADPFTLAGGRTRPSYPAINAWTNEDGAIVTAELPGVNPEDIDIAVEGETLTLSGKREPVALEEGGQYHRRERSFGSFSRTFQLPFKADVDQIEANFDKGVLHISVPRAEADKPRKISVKTA